MAADHSEEVFWDCNEDSLSASDESCDSRHRHSSTSGYSTSDNEELHPDLQDFAYEELGETAELRQTSLRDLRLWLSEQPHLKSCCSEDSPMRLDLPGTDTDNFLLRFLRVKKFNVRKASKMMDKYLSMRCDNPHWFMDLDPVNNQHMQELIDKGYVFVLPQRDAEGRRVIFNYAHVLDPSRHTAADIMKTFMATFETLLAEPENQIRGFTYVLYCKGLTLGHCSVWTPLDAATMFTSCEKNLPIRHRSINLMNLPFAMWAVFEFARSFLSHKIKSRIATLSDDEKLRERLGVENILPLEFGGNIPLAEMTAAWKAELIANRTRLQNLDTLRVSKETRETKKVTSEEDQKERRSYFWSFIPGGLSSSSAANSH